MGSIPVTPTYTDFLSLQMAVTSQTNWSDNFTSKLLPTYFKDGFTILNLMSQYLCIYLVLSHQRVSATSWWFKDGNSKNHDLRDAWVSESSTVCPTLCNTMDCSLPGSPIHGILKARILKWVAVTFSRGSTWPRDGTQDSCIAGRFVTVWATRGACRYIYAYALCFGLPFP